MFLDYHLFRHFVPFAPSKFDLNGTNLSRVTSFIGVYVAYVSLFFVDIKLVVRTIVTSYL